MVEPKTIIIGLAILAVVIAAILVAREVFEKKKSREKQKKVTIRPVKQLR